MLTVTLFAPSRTVVGIDPDIDMLDIARNRPDSSLVTWIMGDANKICPEALRAATPTLEPGTTGRTISLAAPERRRMVRSPS